FCVGVNDGRPGALLVCSMLERPMHYMLKPGEHLVKCRIGSLPLGPRTYEVWASVIEAHGAGGLVDWACVGVFRVDYNEGVLSPISVTVPWLTGPVRVDNAWTVESA